MTDTDTDTDTDANADTDAAGPSAGTDQRAPAEPYTTRFEATVRRVDGRDVILDRTHFYAESGGQPADRGTLGGTPVEDVQYDGDEVRHTLACAPDVEPGEPIVGAVDPDFRTYCMRAHTASHALYGAGRRLFAELGYGGFDIDERKVRVDFETTTDVDDSHVLELERLVNEVVWDSREVTWEELPPEEAMAREEIAFNVKTEEGVLASADRVRVVEIDGWDVAACGGTHVANTREIGPVSVLGRSNPGEGLTRIEFAVGPAAIDRRSVEKTAAVGAARRLETGVDALPAAVERLLEDRAALDAQLAARTERLVEARLDSLTAEATERDGCTWVVGTVEGLDAEDVGDPVRSAVGDVDSSRDGATDSGDASASSNVIALVGDGPRPFVVVATDGAANAGEVVESVTEEFGGGGGGSETFAQGGGLDAAPADVVAFLRG